MRSFLSSLFCVCLFVVTLGCTPPPNNTKDAGQKDASTTDQSSSSDQANPPTDHHHPTDTSRPDLTTKDTSPPPERPMETSTFPDHPAHDATPDKSPDSSTPPPDTASQDTITSQDTIVSPPDTAPFDTPNGELKWYTTCGDPACGGYRVKPDVPLCSDQKPDQPCSTRDATCDPKNNCNSLLKCTDKDPRQQPGGCPISRRAFKQDIRYVRLQERLRLYRELLKLRLATYRYRDAPASSARNLGFLIDDHPNSPAIDASRDMIDMYSYLTMAVAALQIQSHQIQSLQLELQSLRRSLPPSPPSAAFPSLFCPAK